MPQSVEEGLGDLGEVDELEDEASVTDTELESGGGVIVETVVGSPLDVEADDEAVENGIMDGCDFRDLWLLLPLLAFEKGLIQRERERGGRKN
ncbi:unnamed protein product [Camellia sinensis]